MRPNTRMVWVETPTNPLLKLVDLGAVARSCAQRGHPDRRATTPSPRPTSSARSSTASTSSCIRPPSTSTAIRMPSAVRRSCAATRARRTDRLSAKRRRRRRRAVRLASSRCAASRRSRCAWSAIAPTRSPSRSSSRSTRRSSGSTTPGSRATRSMRSRSGRWPGVTAASSLRCCAAAWPAARRLLERCQPVRARGEPGRRGEPDRASGDHDARLASRRDARAVGDQRYAGSAVGRNESAANLIADLRAALA